MPTTPRITVARALLICTLATAPALAQPRVEVLVEHSETYESPSRLSATAERVLVVLTGGSPLERRRTGVLDLQTGAWDEISMNAIMDSTTSPTSPCRVYLNPPVQDNEDLSVSLWSYSNANGCTRPSAGTWIRRPNNEWIAHEGWARGAWNFKLHPNGLVLFGHRRSSASQHPCGPYQFVRWDLTTGDSLVLREYMCISFSTIKAWDENDQPVLREQLSGDMLSASYFDMSQPGEPTLLCSFPGTQERTSRLDINWPTQSTAYIVTQYDANHITSEQVQTPFVWTPGSPLRPVVVAPGWIKPKLIKLSVDGTRGLGTLVPESLPDSEFEYPSIWTLGGGMMPISEALAGHGLADIEGLTNLVDISNDGRRILAVRYVDDPPRPRTALSVVRISDIFCDPIDFNNDGVFPDAQDAEDYLAVLAGGPGACSTGVGNCNDLDFNNDAVTPDDADLAAFLRRLGGGSCDE